MKTQSDVPAPVKAETRAARSSVVEIEQEKPASFFSDLAAGVTVGIVALPLAIGFGIASGVVPSRGLWTAIIAGFLISALGGSLVQVGGPTRAFVPILFGIVAKYGYDGLVVATLIAGVILVVMGAMRLGDLINSIRLQSPGNNDSLAVARK